MKKILVITTTLLLVSGVIFSSTMKSFLKSKLFLSPSTNPNTFQQNPFPPDKQTQNLAAAQQNAASENDHRQNADLFKSPLDRASERVTKKPFGIFITPQNSPVQPERFRGYHTGTDFEIFPEELKADVPVRALCSGTIASKRTVSGYGGVLVQNCTLNNQPITVIYGHLKLASLSKNIGDHLNVGETIGLLGKAYSAETDGERKHLHLGIHKGPAVNILGYAQTQSELSDWIDPCSLVCK